MSFPFSFGDEHLQMPAVSWCEQDRIGSLQSSCRSCIWFFIMYSYCKKNTGRVQKELNEISERKLSPSLVSMFWIVIYFSSAFPSRIENSQLSSCPGRSTSFSWAFSSWLEKMKCSCATQLNRSHGNHGIHGIHCMAVQLQVAMNHLTAGQVPKIPSYTASLKTSWDIHLYQHPINIQWIPIQSSDSIDCLPTNIRTFVTLIVKICACMYLLCKQNRCK